MDDITYTGDKLFCAYSCDLHCELQIKIGNLEGERAERGLEPLLTDPVLRFSGLYDSSGKSDLYITCEVYDGSNQFTPPVQTSYKSFTTRWNWNEWLTLPILYSELPRTSRLLFTIYDCERPCRATVIGIAAITVFNTDGTFHTGLHDLKVWQHPHESTTYSEFTSEEGSDEMSRLAKLCRKHRDGHLPKIDWLDRLTFREVELINEAEKRESKSMYLMIEFPCIEGTTLLYFDQGGDQVFSTMRNPEIVTVRDPEIGEENLVEKKHHTLMRSVRSGYSDKDLKPNAATRDQLHHIVSSPPTKHLSSEEQDLVWKFRFYLCSQKAALSKFLMCVNWEVEGERRQANELLNMWAPMDVGDALQLLGPGYAEGAVRRYAVSRLRQADDEELTLYLLQLVQALKYESFNDIHEALHREMLSTPHPIPTMNMSSLLDKERQLAPANTDGTETVDGMTTTPHPLMNVSSAEPMSLSAPQLTSTSLNAAQTSNSSNGNGSTIAGQLEECDLATFLIHRCCNNDALANYFYWYLWVECDDKEQKDEAVHAMYVEMMKRFNRALMKGDKECRLRKVMLTRQQGFMQKLVEVVRIVHRESGNRMKKIERLQQLLQDDLDLDSTHSRGSFTQFEPLSLPLDPEVKVTGIKPDQATLFKSALMPCKITFSTISHKDYVTIFKYGDDLRQDQLVLQTIILMDKLLRMENLDLKLTPYRVLASSTKHGFVQYIDSVSLGDVIKDESSILSYLRKIGGVCDTTAHGVHPDIMSTYVKSCAGYCVITYILGVGDRHLDNLLITKRGHLFHIDFGFIMGRDPKPLPPPMKLSKEMLEAMGGTASEYYQQFKKLCYTAFLHLRRSSNLILNLFSLMVDANIPDIALEPDKTVRKIQDKFRLDLSDEEAVLYLQNLIDISVTAVIPAVVEQLHKFAQYWKK